MSDERTDRDDDIIELVLTIFRNILHVPDTVSERTSERLHDSAIRALNDIGFIELIISLTNDIAEVGGSC